MRDRARGVLKQANRGAVGDVLRGTKIARHVGCAGDFGFAEHRRRRADLLY
jgi:hypothetical protein